MRQPNEAVSLRSLPMEEQHTLQLVSRLSAALENEGVSYCHWKSNAAIERSASGDNDLDLLIGRGDVQRFVEVLHRLGFKEALTPREQGMPGVVDYYGYDSETSKLVHVHAHYQLVVGHDMTKNYHLPIERAYLASTTPGAPFRVPTPDFEFVVFVIRMVLKHSTWDAILVRQGTLSTAERRELAYLQPRANLAQVRAILSEYLPQIDAGLFDKCVQALQTDCPIWMRIRTGQQLQSKLKGCARRPQLLDVLLKLSRRVYWPIRWRILKQLPRKRLASGGALIAIIGGDGAGKSTAVDGLFSWLSKDFEVMKVHMGKPPWSLTSIAVRGVLSIGRSLGLYPFERAPIHYTLDTDSLEFPGYPWLLREVCVARDRYLTYVKARRFASNGGLVICDRFPITQVKLMDGPQAERMTSNRQSNRLIKLLTRLEKKYYQQIVLPELLVVLKVDPDTAVERKTDEDAVTVRPRSSEIWDLDWRATPAHVIDAGRSKTEVLADLRDLVWSEV